MGVTVRILIACLIAFSVNSAIASTIRYSETSAEDWSPYAMKDKDEPGILVEVIRKTVFAAGFIPEPLHLSTKRAVDGLDKGLIDLDVVNPQWFPNGRVPSNYTTSIPIMQSTSRVIFLSKHQSKYPNFESIRGKNVGTVRGYIYPNERLFKRVDFAGEESLIKLIGIGRIELAILDELSAQYWANQLNVDIGFGPIDSQGPLLLRMVSSNKKLMLELNQALERLKGNGEIQKVVDKYLAKVSSPKKTTSD